MNGFEGSAFFERSIFFYNLFAFVMIVMQGIKKSLVPVVCELRSWVGIFLFVIDALIRLLVRSGK